MRAPYHPLPRGTDLRAAGCATGFEDHASGADRSRPVLARLVREIRRDETLVVVRLDRPARSVSHLFAVIEQLEAGGAHFRSLHDPIDTSTPQGMFSLQVLGAVAQLERALIAERTKAGLNARSRGRIGGNPGMRAGDPDAIRKLRASGDAAHLAGVLTQLDAWLPTVRRMRPDQPWGDVVRVLNRDQVGTWTVERLRRTVRRLVVEGMVEAQLLDRARRHSGDDRLVRLIASIAAAAPDRTLQQIAAQLEAIASVHPGAERAGIPPPSSTYSPGQSGSALQALLQARSGRKSGDSYDAPAPPCSPAPQARSDSARSDRVARWGAAPVQEPATTHVEHLGARECSRPPPPGPMATARLTRRPSPSCMGHRTSPGDWDASVSSMMSWQWPPKTVTASAPWARSARPTRIECSAIQPPSLPINPWNVVPSQVSSIIQFTSGSMGAPPVSLAARARSPS